MLNCKMNFRSLILISSLIVGYAAQSYSALITVELEDFDGPHIFGVVDTSLNTFTINSWTENLGGNEYYTPASVPLIWEAQNAAGISYDVPDLWDGTIDSTWGFRTTSLIAWNEGTVPPLAWAGWGSGNFPISTTVDHTALDALPVSASNRARAILDVVKIDGNFLVGGMVAEPPIWSLLLISLMVFMFASRFRA